MKRYLIALANAAISGIAGAVTGAEVFHGTGKQVLAAFGISAAVSVGKWLLQHPLPGSEDQPK